MTHVGEPLSGRVAIVTGASRGLGRAAAKALVAQGATVLPVARSASDLDRLVTVAPGRFEAAPTDMRDAAAVAALPDRAVERFGRIDVVVNNAGIAPAGSFVDQPQEVWNEVFAVNIRAPAVLSRAAGRHLLAQRSGKIVNIASTSGLKGKPTLVAYSASKGALLQFTTALAAEWGSHGVHVNAIAPGAFETDAQAAVLGHDGLGARHRRGGRTSCDRAVLIDGHTHVHPDHVASRRARGPHPPRGRRPGRGRAGGRRCAGPGSDGSTRSWRTP